MRIRHSFEFSAAHRLEGHSGPCDVLHGHNYTLTVEVFGDVDEVTGMVIDFHELDRLVRMHVVSILDHSFLNDVLRIPTAENMVRWMWTKLAPVLPGLAEIELYELRDAAVVYRGEHER